MRMRSLKVLAVISMADLLTGGAARAVEPARTPAEQAVLKVDREWADALTAQDGAALRRVLNDRFVATFGAAKPLDKAGFIKLILSGERDLTTTQDFSDRTLIVDGDTAVLVETDTLHQTKSGHLSTAVYRMTLTYIKRGGHWTALAEHLVDATR